MLALKLKNPITENGIIRKNCVGSIDANKCIRANSGSFDFYTSPEHNGFHVVDINGETFHTYLKRKNHTIVESRQRREAYLSASCLRHGNRRHCCHRS